MVFQSPELLRQALGELVLCVDAGGTSCKAAIMSADGIVSSSVGDPCNV